MTNKFKKINYLFVMVIIACSESTTEPYTKKYITASVDPVHAGITSPQDRWEAYQLDDYMISYVNDCYCIWGGQVFKVIVKQNQIIDVYDPNGNIVVDSSRYDWFKTIDQQFEFVNSINPDSVAFFKEEYDSLYGYPSNVFVDYDSSMADEEMGFRVSSLEKIIKFN